MQSIAWKDSSPKWPVTYVSRVTYKCLANAKRPCDCHVLCLRLKSSLCSCAHSISDMTSFSCHDQGRATVCAQCSECQREIQEIQKVRVNGGRNYDSLKPSYVDNTARRTKWTALETISRWLLVKKRKTRSLSHPFGHSGVTYELHLWLVGKPVVDFIFVVIELLSLSPTVETLWAEIGRSRRFSKGGGSLRAQISEGRGHRPPTTVGVRKLEWLPFRVVSKYSQCVV